MSPAHNVRNTARHAYAMDAARKYTEKRDGHPLRGTPRQEVCSLAAELGVVVRDGAGEISMEAPRGWVFGSCGTHGVVHDYDHVVGGKLVAWVAVRDDLRYGLAPCLDHADGLCEVCDQ